MRRMFNPCRRSDLGRLVAFGGSVIGACFVILLAQYVLIALGVLLVVATVVYAVRSFVGPIAQPPRTVRTVRLEPTVVQDNAYRAHHERVTAILGRDPYVR